MAASRRQEQSFAHQKLWKKSADGREVRQLRLMRLRLRWKRRACKMAHTIYAVRFHLNEKSTLRYAEYLPLSPLKLHYRTHETGQQLVPIEFFKMLLVDG
jgi:hypothetical protein